MSDVDFNAILDTKVEDIKAKPPCPTGTYNFRIKDLENIVSSKKKTPGVEFTVVTYEAHADVDQDLLTESGGLGRELSITFYITPDSANMVKEFLTNDCGMEGTGKTLRQLLADAKGQVFAGVVVQTPSEKNPERVYAQIDKTLRVPA